MCVMFAATCPQNLNKDYEWFVHTQPTEASRGSKICIYIYIYIYVYDYVRVTIFILLLIRMSSNKDYFNTCIKFDEENWGTLNH